MQIDAPFRLQASCRPVTVDDSLDSTRLELMRSRCDEIATNRNHAHYYWHPSSGTMPSLRCTSCGMHFRRGVSMQQPWLEEIMRKMDRSLTSWLRQKSFSTDKQRPATERAEGGRLGPRARPSVSIFGSLSISPPI